MQHKGASLWKYKDTSNYENFPRCNLDKLLLSERTILVSYRKLQANWPQCYMMSQRQLITNLVPTHNLIRNMKVLIRVFLT